MRPVLPRFPLPCGVTLLNTFTIVKLNTCPHKPDQRSTRGSLRAAFSVVGGAHLRKHAVFGRAVLVRSVPVSPARELA